VDVLPFLIGRSSSFLPCVAVPLTQGMGGQLDRQRKDSPEYGIETRAS
jgi:hypothetical protein